MAEETASKSRRKREARHLQKLGEALIGVSDEALEALDVPDRLKDAVRLARTLHKRGALHRQKQYIGKLMRSIDPGPVEALLEATSAPGREEARLHRLAETWRERLLADPATIDAFMSAYPEADRTTLEQAIHAGLEERERQGPAGGARRLYRVLREIAGRAAESGTADTIPR
jgi:ribosome-associated protein